MVVVGHDGGVKVKTQELRVLVVDDQQPFRQAASMVVEIAEGFTLVGEAETAEEALEMIAADQPDVVLMDINLPGMDGLAATRIVRERFPSVQVLVLSTYEPAEYESRSLEAGAVGFVSKSEFGPGSLEEAFG